MPNETELQYVFCGSIRVPRRDDLEGKTLELGHFEDYLEYCGLLRMALDYGLRPGILITGCLGGKEVYEVVSVDEAVRRIEAEQKKNHDD